LVFKLLSPAEYRVLCLVNKDFRTKAEPFLYSKIQWTWRQEGPCPPITQLLRTVIRKPQLAAYITTICLDGECFRHGPFRRTGPPIPVSGAELDEPIAFIRGTGVHFSDLWIQELGKGVTDAFVALLLAQPSNLRCLYLGPVFTQQSALIGMVLRSAICEPVHHRLPDLQHLRDVSFLLMISEDQLRYKRAKNTADLLPLFYLPNIQRISASIENSAAITWPTARLPIPSNLISLDLTAVREAHLYELLSVTQNLKTLRWEWYYDFGVDDKFNTPIVDLDRIGAAISHVRGTLTDLTILAELNCAAGVPSFPAIKTEGSLHAMVNLDMLKRLQVPLAFLVGFAQDTTKRLQDMIPRNIEFLSITYDLREQNDSYLKPEWPIWEWRDYAVLGLLQLWLEDWKACTPHLRGISLVLEYVDDSFDEWNPSMREQLRELGAQASVQLELIVTDEM
jgi:hypothetical protein